MLLAACCLRLAAPGLARADGLLSPFLPLPAFPVASLLPGGFRGAALGPAAKGKCQAASRASSEAGAAAVAGPGGACPWCRHDAIAGQEEGQVGWQGRTLQCRARERSPRRERETDRPEGRSDGIEGGNVAEAVQPDPPPLGMELTLGCVQAASQHTLAKNGSDLWG